MKTIDITPTWASIIPPLVEVLKNPKAPAQAKKEVTDELIRLAKIVDDHNAVKKAIKLKTTNQPINAS